MATRPIQGAALPRVHDPVTGRYVSKLNDEVQIRVCQAIRSGSSIQAAAGFAGVHPGSVEGWLRQGRARTGTPEHERFADAVDQAYADWEVAAVGRLYQLGMDGDARSLMFLLERKLPARWGQLRRVEHGTREGEPLRVQHSYPMLDVDKLSDEELHTLIELHRKARPDEHPVIDMPGSDQASLGP